jgi:recombinational DNA repair protein (RecF pathway)
MFTAVSWLANMPLHEVCAACGREISGSGFVILDYGELGANCWCRTAVRAASHKTLSFGRKCLI